jgi:hypothetical protein
MRQKTKNDRNRGSNAKFFSFCLVPKSPTQMGSLSANNASKKFSRLGTFKRRSQVSSSSPLNCDMFKNKDKNKFYVTEGGGVHYALYKALLISKLF